MKEHAISCPHDCDACEINSKFHIKTWKGGGCLLCGSLARNGNQWFCNKCWDNSNSETRKKAKAAIGIRG